MLPLDYSSIASSYDSLHSEEQLRKLRIIASELAITPKTTILDVGSGTGLSKILGGKITGIEPSGRLRKLSRINAVKGVAEKLPFKDSSFDIVVSVTAAHNFSNKEKAIKEIARVAKNAAVVTILKSSKHAKLLERLLRKHFSVDKIIGETHDYIFFLSAKHKLY
ncbi:MAG: class I SAM-dependent methyltransferase [Candidatus Woesearchaeota archaeon]